MNKLSAMRLAQRLNQEEPDKIRWSYMPRHSATEAANSSEGGMTEDERAAIVTQYLDAFEAANGFRRKSVRYERGWFSLGYGQKVRKTQLIEYTERLLGRAAAKSAIEAGAHREGEGK